MSKLVLFPLLLLLLSISMPFIHWLNSNDNDLSGIIELNIKPLFENKIPKEKMIVAIHVFKEGSNTTKRVFIGKVNVPFIYRLKIKRIPLGLTHTHSYVWELGKVRVITEERPKFKEIILAIVILDPEYFGTKTLIIEPKKKITHVDVDVRLCRTKKAKSTSLYRLNTLNSARTYTEVAEAKMWLKSGEVHSISGLTVYWCAEVYDTVIYFESYGREIVSIIEPGDVSDSGWVEAGKKPAEAACDDWAYATNGVKRIVMTRVNYKCEHWWYVDPFTGITYDYYYAYPTYFDDVDEGPEISCSYCASDHPEYAADRSPDDPNPFRIGFENSASDEKWLFTRVDVTFWFESGSIRFGVTVTLYRAAGSNTGHPPYLKVYINEWQGDKLYWWYDNNNRKRYVAHFSWE